jgi:cell shape-determining protein MreC
MLQSRKKKNIFPYIILGAIGFLMLWVVASWIRTYRSSIPPVSFETLSLATHSKQSLIKMITALHAEQTNRSARDAEFAILREENRLLKAELQRPLAEGGILGRVIIAPGKSLYDTVTIDAGEREGVQIGQTAYAFGGVALGTVSAVDARQSTILLFSAPGRESSGTVSEGSTTVTLIGRGAGEYEVRMPRDMYFEEGGVISEQSIYAVPLATIEKIVSDPRDPFQRLLAKIPVNIQMITWVLIK